MENLLKRVEDFLQDETDPIANMANISALVFNNMENINWAGFYLYKGGILVLGPFQGTPACVRIELGRGVCGTAAKEKRAIIVANVGDFPGHIACDERSRSEVVVPIIKNGELYGVFDVDSPVVGRFKNEEKELFEQVVKIFLDRSELSGDII